MHKAKERLREFNNIDSGGAMGEEFRVHGYHGVGVEESTHLRTTNEPMK